MRSWANRRKNTLLWLYGSTAQELWTATLVNKLPVGRDALHVDFQKIKKQSHKTQIPCVLTLTLFKEFILLTLNDKFEPQFLSNISRNSNCFLFFPLILCMKWWLPHSQPVPHQKFHLCTLENKNHLQSLSPLIHHHKVFKPTQVTATVSGEPELLPSFCSFPAALNNRDSGLRILKRIWRSFLLPSQQQWSRGISDLAHGHQTLPWGILAPLHEHRAG